jgi:hypothetical protein
MSIPNFYVNKFQKEILLIDVYVDDFLIVSPNIGLNKTLKLYFQRKFDVSNLGEMNYLLNLKVCKLYGGFVSFTIIMHLDILKILKMLDCTPSTPFQYSVKLTRNVLPRKWMLHYTPFQYNVKLIKECPSKKVDVWMLHYIGNLLYLTHHVKHFLCINLLSLFMKNRKEIHLFIAKRICVLYLWYKALWHPLCLLVPNLFGPIQ